MAAASTIEWTEATWNPVTGCTKASEGCVRCYAARMAKRVALLSPGGMFDPERGRLAAEVFVRCAQAGALAGLAESVAADRAKALGAL